MRRREFISALAPGIVSGQSRTGAPQGLQIGDVVPGRAVIWSRADRPSRMHVEWSTTEAFREPHRVLGPDALPENDYTARVDLTGLPDGQRVFVRVRFDDLAGRGSSSVVTGHFRTAPNDSRTVRSVWSGDTAGQGYGINPEWGGMRIYETMRRRNPDFFLHSGDTIYADGPIPREIKLPDGTVWKNVTSEAKAKVAETLEEFRGNYLYNLLDANVRQFNREVPQIWQWDDHEVLNNWSPSKDLSDNAAYRVKDVGLLVARATRAFTEYAPMRLSSGNRDRIYRHIPYGPLLDVFVIDMRSYRGPNTYNRQTVQSDETVFLGKPQLQWLIDGLKASKAKWKVIASDMPVGMMIGDGKDAQGRQRFENASNGDGPALGREFDIAALLRSLKQSSVRNIVWLTADVHHTAAHYYDPGRAQFSDFDPFWEFVSGPLNAGTFGPGTLDNTFGPQVRYFKAPPKGQSNLAPSAGLQFFGEVEIDGSASELTVRLMDVAGAVLFTQRLTPT